MELVLLHLAEVDLQNGFDRYEGYRDGLGEIFLEFVEIGLNQIKSFPKSAPVYTKSYRRLLIGRFPYGIFYSIYPTRIEVYRFLWRLDSLIFIFLTLVVLNASRQRGLCCERVTYFFKLDRVLVSQR